jgi:peptide/nickel transport system substrate-binding protein/oligopeptide transport system substrate-binding protein
MFSYSLFLPFNKEYAESQGEAYGTDPDHIAYNGPYLCTNWTAENSVNFVANESYYDADTVKVKKINYSFNDRSDPLRSYNETKAGTIPGAGLVTSAVAAAKEDGWFDKYAYVVLPGAVSYVGFINVNRQAFANINDGTVVSPQTEEDAARTKQALQNQAFRQALLYSLDRLNYNAQVVGDDLAAVSVTNSYVPGNFVHLEEDVTVEIGGKEVTFKAGDAYGVVLQAALDADDMGVKVWDQTLDNGDGASTGFDGWYNPEKAAEKYAQAVEELKAEGLEISAAAPIQIDLPTAPDESYQNRSMVFKKAIESISEGLVQVNITQCDSTSEWYYAGYYTDFGYEANYDIYDLSGWGPDYLDPSTFLDTMLPDYDGYMVKCIGVF